MKQIVTSAPDCPASDPPARGNDQHLELSEIAYTQVSLRDTTNGVFAGGLPSSLSTTFSSVHELVA
jgi:hypothetical protein